MVNCNREIITYMSYFNRFSLSTKIFKKFLRLSPDEAEFSGVILRLRGSSFCLVLVTVVEFNSCLLDSTSLKQKDQR